MMTSNNQEDQQKQNFEKLLRYLAASGSKGALVKTDTKPDKALHEVAHAISLINDNRRIAKFSLEAIKSALQTGAITQTKLKGHTFYLLTKEGRARLRRAMHKAQISQAERDIGTAEGAQHRQMVPLKIDEKGHQINAMVNACESPLAWLHKRKDKSGKSFIDDDEFLAGERLRNDYERSHLRQRITANWEAALASGKRGASKGGQDIADAALDARARVEKATKALGPELADIAIEICCHLQGLGDVEKAKQWPRSAAKVVLKIALGRLANHYGYKSEAKQNKNTKKTNHNWNDGQHKPSIGLLPENTNAYPANSA